MTKHFLFVIFFMNENIGSDNKIPIDFPYCTHFCLNRRACITQFVVRSFVFFFVSRVNESRSLSRLFYSWQLKSSVAIWIQCDPNTIRKLNWLRCLRAQIRHETLTFLHISHMFNEEKEKITHSLNLYMCSPFFLHRRSHFTEADTFSENFRDTFAWNSVISC